MMYNEHPFLDRFAAAARDGFKGVEFLFPYAYVIKEILQRLRDSGLILVLFNYPPGDWEKGERGIASLPGREEEFKRGIENAFGYADKLGCTRLHVMAGVGQAGQDRQQHAPPISISLPTLRSKLLCMALPSGLSQ